MLDSLWFRFAGINIIWGTEVITLSISDLLKDEICRMFNKSRTVIG
jgi:hypothetical protein